MSNCIFILGKINKRLLFPLIYIIIHIPMHLYWKKYGDYGYNQAEFYLEYFGCSIGEILTVLVRAFIYRGNSKNIEKDSNTQNNNYFKNYGIMFLFEILSDICALLCDFWRYGRRAGELPCLSGGGLHHRPIGIPSEILPSIGAFGEADPLGIS